MVGPNCKTMNVKYYVRLEGESKHIHSFYKEIGAELDGELVTRKMMNDSNVQEGVTYWKSASIDSSLLTLSEDLESFLERFSTLNVAEAGMRLEAEVVVTHLPNESPVGFFVGAGLIKILAQFDASLDIDVVPFID